jgi:hypothetical protein
MTLLTSNDSASYVVPVAKRACGALIDWANNPVIG